MLSQSFFPILARGLFPKLLVKALQFSVSPEMRFPVTNKASDQSEHTPSLITVVPFSCFKKFLALSLSDVLFIMLINNCWHFNIYEQDQFCAQLS